MIILQMGEKLMDIGRTGSYLFGEREKNSIRFLKSELEKHSLPITKKQVELYKDDDYLVNHFASVNEAIAESLMQTEDYQHLVQVLRKIKAGTRKKLYTNKDSIPQVIQDDPSPMAYCWLGISVPQSPDNKLVKILVEADYEPVDRNNNGVISLKDGDTIGSNIGNYLYDKDNNAAFMTAFKGKPALTETWFTDAWGTFYSSVIPIIDKNNEVLAVLNIVYDVSSEVNRVKNLLYTLYTINIVTLIFSIIVSYFISRIISRPLNQLKAAAETVSSGNYDIAINIKSGDEIEILASAFNLMIEKIRDYTNILKDEVNHQSMNYQQSEGRYKELVELSPLGIVVHRDAQILFINNSGVEAVKGSDAKSIIGKSVFDFVIDNNQDKADRSIEAAFLNPDANRVDKKLLCLDGSIIDVEISSARIKYENTKAILTVFKDISEKKRVEKLRENTQRIMNHDLKNPLNSIIGLSDMILMKNKFDLSSKKYIKTINDSGKTMQMMIDSTLNLFKMEEGMYQIMAEDVNLTEIFEELHVRFSSLLNAKRLKIQYYFNDQPFLFDQNIFLQSEKLNLDILFSNLIKNAIEASPNNKQIEIRIVEREKHIQVTIHNEGAIPKSMRAAFFDAYSTYGKQYGTGLGTYSAKLIVDSYKGKIHFETDSVKGTKLIVLLPKMLI